MGKNIIVAGVSSGLGLALAAEYAKSGHRVFGCGRRNAVDLDGVSYQPVDIGDAETVRTWVEDIEAEAGSIDLCVNCAGSLASGKMLWEFTEDDTLNMLKVNVIGLINLLRQVIPLLKEQQYGTFVTMASNPAGYPLKGLGLYGMCKTAAEKLIEVLAEELPSGVISVALYPGLVNTPMLQKSIGVDAAGAYPAAADWARKSANALLHLEKKHHGLHVDLTDIVV